MFLDDELLEICRNVSLKDCEDVQSLNQHICKKCESYYKSKLNYKSTDKEVEAVLNKTFNLFASFVRMALKDTDPIVVIYGTMFEKHTFKQQFLSNPEMKKVYDSL